MRKRSDRFILSNHSDPFYRVYGNARFPELFEGSPLPGLIYSDLMTAYANMRFYNQQERMLKRREKIAKEDSELKNAVGDCLFRKLNLDQAKWKRYSCSVKANDSFFIADPRLICVSCILFRRR